MTVNATSPLFKILPAGEDYCEAVNDHYQQQLARMDECQPMELLDGSTVTFNCYDYIEDLMCSKPRVERSSVYFYEGDCLDLVDLWSQSGCHRLTGFCY